MKKTKVKDSKAKLRIDLSSLESSISNLNHSPFDVLFFEAYFLFLQALIILGSMNFQSTWQAQNFRIYVYSAVILLLGFIKRFKAHYANIDPLGISNWTTIMNVTDVVLQVNTFYLLVRIVADIPLSHSLGVVLQYSKIKLSCFYSAYKQIDGSKKLPKFKYRSVKPSSIKIVQPLVLFILCKVICRGFNEVSLVFLVFSLINILSFLEMGNALFFKSFILGFWHRSFSQVEDSKKYSLRTRRIVLKNLLVMGALAITVENLLAVHDRLRYQISISLTQSLLVGGYGYYKYRALDPVENRAQMQVENRAQMQVENRAQMQVEKPIGG